MSIFKVNKTNNFTVMSNQHLKNKDLSLKAKGLLSVMLSLPEDWDYSIKGLVSIIKESETALKSTLNELKEQGYLQIIQEKNIKGQFEYTYNIFETPLPQTPYTGFPYMDNLKVEDHIQLNTNLQNIELQNTKNNIYIKENEIENNVKHVDKNIEPQHQPMIESAKKILNYLNELKGTKYRFQGEIQKNILARLKEFSEEEIIGMIKFKYDKWKGTDYEVYLRPITIFNKNKCEEYINQALVEHKKLKQPKNYTGSHYGFI